MIQNKKNVPLPGNKYYKKMKAFLFFLCPWNRIFGLLFNAI